MAAVKRSKERTVAFFEIVRETANGRDTERIGQADWQTLLTFLGDRPLKERMVNAYDQILIGEILHYEERAHLKLLKVRDQDAWLGIYNGEAMSLEDLSIDESNQLYETSIVSFLDYGNIIGMIQGSTSAPTSTTVGQWINALKILDGDQPLTTQAVVSHEAMEKLSRASEATRVETKVNTSKASALEKRGSKLSSVLRKVSDEFGPMTVTIILQTSRARSNTEGRQILKQEVENLAAAANEKDVDKAKAKLVYIDADEQSTSEQVDFIKQRITAKRQIATTDDDGSPIRNVSAVRAIVDVARQHDAELRTAVGVTRPASGA